jgi:hypothetical protein
MSKMRYGMRQKQIKWNKSKNPSKEAHAKSNDKTAQQTTDRDLEPNMRHTKVNIA